MAGLTDVQYVSDADGENIGVIVPIDLWHAIESARETAHLVSSAAMKRRLLEAKDLRGVLRGLDTSVGRDEGVEVEEAGGTIGA